jgi:signal transduction histidine kinase
MSSNKTIESIKSNDLFKELDFASLNIPFDAKNFLEFKEGDLIYSSGHSSDFVYLIVNGEVKLKLNSIKRLFFKSPNEFFGESEVLEKTPRSSSALANSDCLIYKIDESLFNKLMSDSPSFSGNLLRSDNQEPNENQVTQQVQELTNNESIQNQVTESVSELNYKIPEVDLHAEPAKFDLNDFVDIKPKYETTVDLDKIEIEHYEQEPDLDAFIQQKYLENDNKSLKSKLIDDPDDMTNWVITEGSMEAVSETYLQSSTLKKSETTSNISSAVNRTADLVNESVSEISFNESSTPQLTHETENAGINNKPDLRQISNFIMQDVKAPLLTIKHYSSILSRFDLPEEVKRVVSLLGSQANSVIDLLQSSIDFSDKNTRTKLEVVSFNEVMDNNLILLSDYVESRNVKLFKKLGEDAKIKIDTRKFYVACYYIARFACDIMKQGGNLYFSSQVEDTNVVLHIKDGNKIDSKDLLENVFDPGFTNNTNESVGLSLAIAKFIIESMNGSITLQNAESGTSYLVSIPISS